MAKSSNVIQKSYYLDKVLDRELIDFLNQIRSKSEFVRRALYHEMESYKQNGSELMILDKNIPNNNKIINEEENEKENMYATEDEINDFLSVLNINNN